MSTSELERSLIAAYGYGLLVLYIFNKHKHSINMPTSELESSLIRLKYGTLTASFCWYNIMPYHIKTNSVRVLKLLLHY